MRFWLLLGTIAAATVSSTTSAAGPDHIWIVGSGTAHPYITAVAERAARAADGRVPIVEHTGTTLAFAYLCGGPGAGHPNAASVTRRMTKREFDTCVEKGVNEIAEIPVGLDILVVAQSKAGPRMQLTLTKIFLALARDIPVAMVDSSPIRTATGPVSTKHCPTPGSMYAFYRRLPARATHCRNFCGKGLSTFRTLPG
jgi:hypothetical protein